MRSRVALCSAGLARALEGSGPHGKRNRCDLTTPGVHLPAFPPSKALVQHGRGGPGRNSKGQPREDGQGSKVGGARGDLLVLCLA
eukprot:1107054-Pyramimonas_sp.AAC.1